MSIDFRRVLKCWYQHHVKKRTDRRKMTCSMVKRPPLPRSSSLLLTKLLKLVGWAKLAANFDSIPVIVSTRQYGSLLGKKQGKRGGRPPCKAARKSEKVGEEIKAMVKALSKWLLVEERNMCLEEYTLKANGY